MRAAGAPQRPLVLCGACGRRRAKVRRRDLKSVFRRRISWMSGRIRAFRGKVHLFLPTGGDGFSSRTYYASKGIMMFAYSQQNTSHDRFCRRRKNRRIITPCGCVRNCSTLWKQPSAAGRSVAGQRHSARGDGRPFGQPDGEFSDGRDFAYSFRFRAAHVDHCRTADFSAPVFPCSQKAGVGRRRVRSVWFHGGDVLCAVGHAKRRDVPAAVLPGRCFPAVRTRSIRCAPPGC